MKEIDCRGLECPKEIKVVKKYFNSIGEGEAIVIVDNKISHENVVKYAMRKGYHVTSNDESNIKIEKRGCLEVLEEEKRLVILITNEKLGIGEEALGVKLMERYFEALSDSDILPRELIFVNSAVKFLLEDSKVLDSLRLLIERGVKIYASELSINYYNAQDKMVLGKIIDMDDIVEEMYLADDFIKI